MKSHPVAVLAVLLRRHVYIVVAFAWLIGACGSPQSSSEPADHSDRVGIEDAWAASLHARWMRADQKGERTSSPANELRFDDRVLHETWKDSTEREGRWKLLSASSDTIHISLDSGGLETQFWRLSLGNDDELVLFLPGHEPTTYYRADSAILEAASKKESAGALAAGAEFASQALNADHPASDDAASDDVDLEERASENIAAASTAAEQAADISIAAADVATATAPSSKQQALHARHGAPTQEALARQMRSVGVSMGNSERNLGERLVIGVWDLSDESRAALKEDGAQQHSIDSLTVRFNAGGTARMETVLAGDLTVERGVWALEGMYGPEVRVILTLTGSSPRRERMLFLDIDRFVLSPQDGALTFTRKRP